MREGTAPTALTAALSSSPSREPLPSASRPAKRSHSSAGDMRATGLGRGGSRTAPGADGNKEETRRDGRQGQGEVRLQHGS